MIYSARFSRSFALASSRFFFRLSSLIHIKSFVQFPVLGTCQRIDESVEFMNLADEIVIYEGADAQVEVRLQEQSVWLSQAQMSELFGKDVRTVNEHILNIYEEEELGRDATIRNFRIVRQEGKRQVGREMASAN